MKKEFTFEERICQDIKLLTVSDEFIADVKIISEKYNLPSNNLDVDEDGRPFILDNDEFENDSEQLRHKYNLLESHGFALVNYLLSGQALLSGTEFWHLNPGVIVQNTKDCVTLKIYPETTLEDIKKNWPRIKKWRDGILNLDTERKSRIVNLERDLYIYELKKQGMTAMEVVKKLTKNEKFKNEIIGYEDVPMIIKRLKERANRNISRKQS